MEVYKLIKRRRTELGLTLKDVANALGVAESTVSRYESSEIQNMGIDKIEALSKILRCSPAYLMGWDDNISTNKNLLNLSPLEKEIITRYRQADEISKAMVHKALDIDEQLFSGKEGTA